MPKKVEECVEALKEKGYSKDEAWAICNSQMGTSAPMAEKIDRRVQVVTRRGVQEPE